MVFPFSMQGLDSTTSLDVVRLLRRIASQRVNVICVLHQPRNLIFDLFDDMLLLAPEGLTVYNGKASKAVRYFRQKNFPCPPTTNPSDWFIDVLSGKVPLPPNSNINSDEKNNNDVKSIKIDAPAGKPNNNDDDESVPSSQLAPIVQVSIFLAPLFSLLSPRALMFLSHYAYPLSPLFDYLTRNIWWLSGSNSSKINTTNNPTPMPDLYLPQPTSPLPPPLPSLVVCVVA